MQTYTTPGGVTVPPNVNAVQQLKVRADAAPNHPALAYRDGPGFVDVSTAELWQTVQDIAAGLVALGVEKGDRVALYCATRIEFTYFDYAIWAAGAATSTIYETSSEDQVRWIMSDSEAVLLIAETEDMASIGRSATEGIDTCREILTIDGGAVDHLKSMGTDESRAEVKRRVAAIAHDDLATLVYTSGTTGNPKGCVLTHHNFVWESMALDGGLAALLAPGNRTLMFLPLAHIFARAVQSAAVGAGCTIGYSTGIPNLMEELPMFKPTWVFSVPRVFEKVYNGAKGRADGDGKGSHLRPCCGDRDRLQPGHPARQGRHGHQGHACRVRSPRLLQAPCCFRRRILGSDLRRCTPRCPTRPLLPRRRDHDLRGIRPDGDDGRCNREHPRCDQDRHGRPPGCWVIDPDRQRR